MLIVHVHVHVKPESVAEGLRQATIENAREVQEPGSRASTWSSTLTP